MPELGRIWWRDPDGNAGHGEWLLLTVALSVAKAWGNEVSGRRVTVERSTGQDGWAEEQRTAAG